MFNRTALALFLLISVLVALPAAAHAACTVQIGGIDYIDADCDGIRDAFDNCPAVPNGDCDALTRNCDMDRDGTLSEEELGAGDQADWNGDGIGDACIDSDSDGFEDYRDNCPGTRNPGQADGDCSDADGDRVEDNLDNCPTVYNSRQEDADGDGFGDVCDVCPFTDNPGQDLNDCPAAERNPVSPNEGTPNNERNPGVSYGVQQEHAEGSGGCSMTGGVEAAPWALMLAASAVCLAAVRRRFKR